MKERRSYMREEVKWRREKEGGVRRVRRDGERVTG